MIRLQKLISAKLQSYNFLKNIKRVGKNFPLFLYAILAYLQVLIFSLRAYALDNGRFLVIENEYIIL